MLIFTNREQENEMSLENYIKIQDNFWETISQENELSGIDLNCLFAGFHETYFSSASDNALFVEIESLSEEANIFLRLLSDNHKAARTTNINR